MNYLSATAKTILAVALLANLALLGVRAHLLGQATARPAAQIWFPIPDAIPSGYLANGLAYGPALTRSRCFALSYTASDCGFCSAQLPDWRKIVERASDLGCDALRVVPDRHAGSKRDSASILGRELVFLNPGWASGNPPALTPTTIIFALGAHAAWCHVGQLDPASTRTAISELILAARSRAGVPASRNGKSDRMKCR